MYLKNSVVNSIDLILSSRELAYLSSEDRRAFKKTLLRFLEERLINCILKYIPDHKLSSFRSVLLTKDSDNIYNFILAEVPDYDNIISEEVEVFFSEMKESL